MFFSDDETPAVSFKPVAAATAKPLPSVHPSISLKQENGFQQQVIHEYTISRTAS